MSESSLYNRVRPKSLDEVIGQTNAVKQIRGYGGKLPAAILFTGPSGCLRGDMRLFDPMDGSNNTIEDRFDAKKPFFVWSYCKKNNDAVLAMAMPPVRYSIADMYRIVMDDDRELFVTQHHRILSSCGAYVPVLSFLRRWRASERILLPSISDTGQIAQSEDALHYLRTLADYSGCCRLSRHFCDARLLFSSKVFPESFRQQYDVPTRSHLAHADGLVDGLEYTQPEFVYDRPSMQDYGGRNFPYPFLQYRSALRTHEHESYSSDTFGQYEELTLQRYITHQLQCRVLESTQISASTSWRSVENKRPLAYQPPFEYGTSTGAVIKHIEKCGKDVYYDFHVPCYNNYIMNGLVHHNCSKTTLGRICARIAGCNLDDPKSPSPDYRELNCGTVDPIDTVRDIERSMTSCPWKDGGKKVYLLDEAQSFKKSRGAQEGLLKVLEDGPEHAIFILCSTAPKDLLPTIRNRCTEIVCKPLTAGEMMTLLRRTCKSEKVEVEDQVLDKIIDTVSGSARKALVQLEKVFGLDPADRLKAVEREGVDKIGFDLAKELMPFKGSPKWESVAAILSEIDEYEPESIRVPIMGLARSVLLEGDDRALHAYKVIRAFSEPFYDPVGARALLAAACYQVVHANPK